MIELIVALVFGFAGIQPLGAEVTAYTPDGCVRSETIPLERRFIWCDGKTTSGRPIQIGETAACPDSIPFGTGIWIEGIGHRTCWDRGCNCFDVLVATEREARAISAVRRVVLVVSLAWEGNAG